MFGFGFSKEKSRASAEKYLQQNKLQNAINEYEKILRVEPNDLAIVNTVGDIYSRLGQNEKAIERFRQVAESYANDGLTLKSIAMYRKIVKLDTSDLATMEKLAELYRKQGLVTDARSMLLQAADAYTKKSQPMETLRLLKQLVAFDPENVQVITRTADLLNGSGQKAEAIQMLSQSSTTLIMRQAFGPAQKVLERLLGIDRGNLRAQELRAQVTLELGDSAKAAEYYEAIPDIDSRPDAMRNLLMAYLNIGKLEDATPVARKLATIHQDASGISKLAARLYQEGDFLGSLGLYSEFVDRVFAHDKEDALSHLHGIIGRVRDNPDALQMLYDLLRRSGDGSSLAEVLELLAHASVQNNQLERAKKAYKELIELEPGNNSHIQGYRQVCARMGSSSAAAEPVKPQAESGPHTLDEFFQSDEPELPRQEYSPLVEDKIAAALSEAELCESFASKSRGIHALELAIESAPDDLQLNRTLAMLYRQANEPARAAQCYTTMQRVLESMGETEAAGYYANLIGADQTTTWEASGSEFSAGDFENAPKADDGATAEEIDLSGEWESVWEEPGELPEPAEPAPIAAAPVEVPAEVAELVEEVRFCLAQQFWSEAEAGIARIAAASPGFPDLAAFRSQLARGRVGIFPTAPEEPAPEAEADIEVIEVTDEESPAPGPVAPVFSPGPAPAPTLNALAAELDLELGESFEPVAKPREPMPSPRPAAPAARPVPVSAPPPPALAPQPAPAAFNPPAQPAAFAPPAPVQEQPPAPGLFSDLLQEFENDLPAPQEDEGDAETHYNLGIAYRETGLLEEAIGELQEACRISDHGLTPAQLHRAYIWLAICFSEKSVPEASVKWYLRALETAPDEESRTAVNYELAKAYEAAGRKREALDHFMEVYGSNIHYQDVASRIRELRGSI
jgi:tetratricopeptide (TPR) repeat protein